MLQSNSYFHFHSGKKGDLSCDVSRVWGRRDCKLLKAAGSWEFMQKCSKRILPRLGMWAEDERRKTFERLKVDFWISSLD